MIETHREPTTGARVYLVDDDASTRAQMKLVLRGSAFEVIELEDAEQCLEAYDPEIPGCIVLDLRMPGMSGLDLQDALHERFDWCIPIVFQTGYAEILPAVRALRAGALDFFEKPVRPETLLRSVADAVEADLEQRKRHTRASRLRGRLASLTRREREVMDGVVSGSPNRGIASALGISEKTVENHRARVMQKVGASSLAELVRIALATEEFASAA